MRETRVTVVVRTHQRPAELRRTLAHLCRLPERPEIVVVDNGSCPRNARAIREAAAEAGVGLLRLSHHVGAAACNLAVAHVRTPYVAFCDDDTWWADGALERAVSIMDTCPDVGLVNGRVLVGPEQREAKVCRRMASSQLERAGLPGTSLLSFLPGAVVMRMAAFREAGGYEPRLGLGAEAVLMGLDLATIGWHMLYAPDVVVHHHPSPACRRPERQVILARNRLWVAVLRLPWGDVLREARQILRQAQVDGVAGRVLWRAAAGLAWPLLNRQVVPVDVIRLYRGWHAEPERGHAICRGRMAGMH